MAGRVQDVAALKYGDLDPNDADSKKEKSLVAVNLRALKTEARKTFIFAQTYKILQARQAERQLNDEDYVFTIPDTKKQHYSANSMQKRISRWLKKQGMCPRTHNLRVTRATEWYKTSKSNIKMVQQLLGHKSILTTQRYVTITDDEKMAVFLRSASTATRKAQNSV